MEFGCTSEAKSQFICNRKSTRPEVWLFTDFSQYLAKNFIELRTWVVDTYHAYWDGRPLPTVFAEA